MQKFTRYETTYLHYSFTPLHLFGNRRKWDVLKFMLVLRWMRFIGWIWIKKRNSTRLGVCYFSALSPTHSILHISVAILKLQHYANKYKLFMLSSIYKSSRKSIRRTGRVYNIDQYFYITPHNNDILYIFWLIRRKWG